MKAAVYRGPGDIRIEEQEEGAPVGHEPMGIVEVVGEEVTSVQPGDRVLSPFEISCGECEFCRKGLHMSCVNGDNWGPHGGADGAQGEEVVIHDIQLTDNRTIVATCRQCGKELTTG